MCDKTYIFGYGSIINNESRASTAADEHSTVVFVTLNKNAKLVREWNFRSQTGFTALGLRFVESAEDAREVNGVMYSVDTTALQAFDEREKGYDRVKLEAEWLHIHQKTTPSTTSPAPGNDEEDLHHPAAGGGREGGINGAAGVTAAAEVVEELKTGVATCWVYVPQVTERATSDFPICQTYVDCVMLGCLDWGGHHQAEAFITSTGGWSEYYLNDTPLSRRPWLHRREHATIDSLLSRHAKWTRFQERRHPEEFSSHFLSGPRGIWGVPKRNPAFTGRSAQLEAIECRFQAEEARVGGGGGVREVAVTGLGGVGKTQSVAEYCYRRYGSGYGLVLWVRAEEVDTLEGDLRRLAVDSGLNVQGKTNQEVVEEVQAQLYRCQCAWLMVFDNLEDEDLIAKYSPRGANCGHILITTRRMLSSWSESTVQLDCFTPAESLAFMRNSLGQLGNHRRHSSSSLLTPGGGGGGEGCSGAEGRVCEELGHLPLALAMAAAYMKRCDITPQDYLAKYLQSCHKVLEREAARVACYPLSVASSLGLTLTEMAREAPEARQVLDSLAYLYPDGLSKPIVHALNAQHTRLKNVVAKAEKESQSQKGDVKDKASSHSSAKRSRRRSQLAEESPPLLLLAGSFVAATSALAWVMPAQHWSTASDDKFRRSVAVWSAVAASTLTAAAGYWVWYHSPLRLYNPTTNRPSHQAGEEERESEGSGRRERSPGTSSGGGRVAALPSAISLGRDMADLNTWTQAQAAKGVEEDEEDEDELLDLEADRIWSILKTFSVITVRHYHASIHRLLQSVLRASHSPSEACRAVVAGLAGLEGLWQFDPADPATWAEAGRLVEHVKAIARQGSGLDCSQRGCLGRLLTGAARYMSVVQSHFKEALEVLGQALTLHQSRGGDDTHEDGRSAARDTASTLHELGKVSRYLGRLDRAEEHLTRALNIHNQLTLPKTHQTATSGAPECVGRGDRSGGSVGGGGSGGVSAVLHELGVLHVKRHDLKTAQHFLHQALSLKQAHSRAVASERPSSSSLSSAWPDDVNNDLQGGSAVGRWVAAVARARADEAATLHQLAVAATNTKPPDLDTAEALLQDALRLEMDACDLHSSSSGTDRPTTTSTSSSFLTSSSSSSSRAEEAGLSRLASCSTAVASTLQQLARVSIRRGRLQQAQTYLQEALALQQRAYGSERHVNVAATRHQLGVAALAGGDSEEARRHLRAALDLRRSLYHHQGGLHPEVANTLHELGKAEKAAGDSAAAEAVFKEEQCILTSLLTSPGPLTPHTSRSNLLRTEDEDGGSQQRASLIHTSSSSFKGSGLSSPNPQSQIQRALMQEKINGLFFLRNIAKDRGDKEKATEYSNEAKKLQSVHKLTDPSKKVEYSLRPSLSADQSANTLSPRCVHSNEDIDRLSHKLLTFRQYLRTELKRKSTSCNHDNCVREVQCMLAELRNQLEEISSIYDENDVETCESTSTLPAAYVVAQQFASDVGDWVGDSSTPNTHACVFCDKPARAQLFQMCDEVRCSMRKAGIKVEDSAT